MRHLAVGAAGEEVLYLRTISDVDGEADEDAVIVRQLALAHHLGILLRRIGLARELPAVHGAAGDKAAGAALTRI